MPSVHAPAAVTRASFGETTDGKPVELLTLTNPSGIELRALTYGGIIVGLRVPDREGQLDDIVLGHDTLEGYLERSPYFGAIIGRHANRIAGGRFRIDGVEYQLTLNDGLHHLHGGQHGFDRVVWSAEPFRREARVGVIFTHVSPDGDQGYPGTLRTSVSYALTNRNELLLDYVATCDRPTPLNLTQHSYWNLAGGSAPSVLGHEITINAGHYTPVDATLIPTGSITPVKGTPFDFRTAQPIGRHIDDADEQLRHGLGYDHNFVLSPAPPGALRHAVRLFEPRSGRVLDMHTTEPGVQFYSGNFLDGSIRGKGGTVYGYRSGLCLESQHFPDSPNHSNFPSVILLPGAEYRSRTVYTFSAH